MYCKVNLQLVSSISTQGKKVPNCNCASKDDQHIFPQINDLPNCLTIKYNRYNDGEPNKSQGSSQISLEYVYSKQQPTSHHLLEKNTTKIHHELTNIYCKFCCDLYIEAFQIGTLFAYKDIQDLET